MRRRTPIRLTENNLKNLVAEATRRIMNEIDQKTVAMAAKKALDRGLKREAGGKASKATVRRITKRLAKNEAFLNLPPDRKLDVIKTELANDYYSRAMYFGANSLDGDSKFATPEGIEQTAKRILRDYFYDNDEGKWKEIEVDMPDLGFDYSDLYSDSSDNM